MSSATRECIAKAAAGALESLGARREILNSLNVFPVPDGDTGINLYLTVKAAIEEMERDPRSDPAKAISDFAHGALMGSRGNSGIILSQMLEGMASEITGTSFEVADLLKGINTGVELAYRSVHKPVEGTMLTVLRQTASGLSGGEADFGEMLTEAYGLAAGSMLDTPTMLPELARAGVVDSGGAGVVAALEGVLDALGLKAGAVDWDGLAPAQSAPELATPYKGPGKGVSFLIECDRSRVDELEGMLAELGNSLAVAGTASTFRIHIHTNFPEQVIDSAKAMGTVSDLSVVSFSEPAAGTTVPARSRFFPSVVIAFCPGVGLSMLFESMGAQTVMAGPGFQPSTGEVVDLIRGHEGEVVVFLPNDADTLKVVEMAVRMDGRESRVIPTVSPVQGLAAMEEYMADEEPEKIFHNMARAASLVRTGAVARAVRDAELGHLKVKTGQFIGFVENKAVAVGESIGEVAEPVCAELASGGSGSLITAVSGQGVGSLEAEETMRRIEDSFPDMELDWHAGGQLYYQLLLGVQYLSTP